MWIRKRCPPRSPPSPPLPPIARSSMGIPAARAPQGLHSGRSFAVVEENRRIGWSCINLPRNNPLHHLGINDPLPLHLSQTITMGTKQRDEVEKDAAEKTLMIPNADCGMQQKTALLALPFDSTPQGFSGFVDAERETEMEIIPPKKRKGTYCLVAEEEETVREPVTLPTIVKDETAGGKGNKPDNHGVPLLVESETMDDSVREFKEETTVIDEGRETVAETVDKGTQTDFNGDAGGKSNGIKKETNGEENYPKKRRKRGTVLLEGSRCSRVNGRGWRCRQMTMVGYSLCQHHLGKGRIKSIDSIGSTDVSVTSGPKKGANNQLPCDSSLVMKYLHHLEFSGDHQGEEKPRGGGRRGRSRCRCRCRCRC
ncbi:PREDICTED: uncharacterized protein LOC104597546 isoform X2 [Nelumbo nucifera]|uniref:Uncharacterized protein LOC104597546 isoform X2 n=2 Tax=Nelumbo nucifera TaxID=4432 RepID=A0A1U7ZT10_NELNU|nr:PREDICTED: uncharacterized protein LOC104597546 isoform X2 [Nelumbo nucifera]DAD42214.1 TPA_asm: hypothetical protein HUJ06_000444 [Nelumbo nucifera]